jgi:hypothetical protein
MKKIITLFSYLLLTGCFCFSQNVGVGTSTPAEKLDVNGNLNVSGNIKINNTTGQEGEVLRTNSSGNTEWARIGDYQNFQSFTSTIAANWTVPAGVTKILVEAWGGGGGGAVGGGGGGGGYVMAQYNVTPGTIVNITCGAGGAAPLTIGANGGDGGTTIVVINSLQQIANGGFGAFFASAGTGGNAGIVTSSAVQQIGISGEGGNSSTELYGQFSSTVFYTAVQFGKGGNAPFAPVTGGNGGFRSYNSATAVTIKRLPSTIGTRPGGGGGGGGDSNSFFGHDGGGGMVIIRW